VRLDGRPEGACSGSLLSATFFYTPVSPKLALVPVSGMIHLSESAKLRRKAPLLRHIADFVFTAQKPPGKRIERNHCETFFLRQREKFSLNFTEQQVIAWLDRNETRHPERVLPSKRFCQTVGEKV
jgi:hypothetical protein